MAVLIWIATVYTIAVMVPTVLTVVDFIRGNPEEMED